MKVQAIHGTTRGFIKWTWEELQFAAEGFQQAVQEEKNARAACCLLALQYMVRVVEEDLHGNTKSILRCK